MFKMTKITEKKNVDQLKDFKKVDVASEKTTTIAASTGKQLNKSKKPKPIVSLTHASQVFDDNPLSEDYIVGKSFNLSKRVGLNSAADVQLYCNATKSAINKTISDGIKQKAVNNV